MAHRYFEGKLHAQLYAKYRTVPPTSLIDRMVSFLKEKYNGKLNLAYDVGCGSGQSTTFLAPHFHKVVGTDISASQIEEATQRIQLSNVSFQVGPSEIIKEPDNSVQMVSVSQAAHWFDLPKFYEEGKRVLSPGGVMCLYGYEFPRFRWDKNPAVNKKLDDALDQFYFEDLSDYVLQGSREVYLEKYTQPRFKIPYTDFLYAVDLNGYWAAERKIVDNRYAEFVIPYNDFTRDDSFFHEHETSVADVVNYCYTWSGYQNFVKKNGEEEGQKLIDKFQQSVMSTLNVDSSPEETILTRRTGFFLLMGRK